MLDENKMMTRREYNASQSLHLHTPVPAVLAVFRKDGRSHVFENVTTIVYIGEQAMLTFDIRGRAYNFPDVDYWTVEYTK